MPSGPQICALRASALRMSGSGSIGLLYWPTATAADSRRAYTLAGALACGDTAHGLDLCAAARLAGWATPLVTDDSGAYTEKQVRQRMDNKAHGRYSASNVQMSQLAGWATPTGRDWKDTPGMEIRAINANGTYRRRLDSWPRQASGPILTGYFAETEKRARLNPEFSRWLMGFPEGWSC